LVEAFEVKWTAKGDQYAILFDRKIVIYDMNAQPLTTIGHRVRIHCIQYFQHPVHGETLLAGTDDKLIRIYSVTDGSVLQELKGHRARYGFRSGHTNCRVKSFDNVVMSHDGDVRLLASASSDGEVKSWTMTEDGSVTENGTYDTGNRLLCLTLHDAAIEQLDLFPTPLSKVHDSDLSSESEDSEDKDEDGEEDEDEWNGIDDE
jgi:protein MAK11